jgi:hypothetical protein
MDTWTARLQRADFCKMSDDKWEKVMRYLDHYVDEAVHFVGEEVGVRWRGFGQSDGDDNEEEEEEKEKPALDYNHDDENEGEWQTQNQKRSKKK